MKSIVKSLEVEKLAEKIVELLIMGFTRAEIVEHLRGPAGPQVKPTRTQITKLINEARPRIQAAAQVDRETETGQAILRLQSLYKQSMLIADYKTALAVQREINTLLQLSADRPAAAAATAPIKRQDQAIEPVLTELDKLDPTGDLTYLEIIKMAHKKINRRRK